MYDPQKILETHLIFNRGSDGRANSRQSGLLVLWCRHWQRYAMNTNYRSPETSCSPILGTMDAMMTSSTDVWVRLIAMTSYDVLMILLFFHRIHRSKWLKTARQRYLRFCGLWFDIFIISSLMGLAAYWSETVSSSTSPSDNRTSEDDISLVHILPERLHLRPFNWENPFITTCTPYGCYDDSADQFPRLNPFFWITKPAMPGSESRAVL